MLGKDGEKEQKLCRFLEGFFPPSHVKNHQILARLCLFPPRAGGLRAGDILLGCPQGGVGHPGAGGLHPNPPNHPNPAWELLPVRVRLGLLVQEQDGAGEAWREPPAKHQTWNPKPDMGCGLLAPNEADLGCLRARGVQNKPSSTAGSRKSPLGGDVPILGGLKALVPVGTRSPPGPRHGTDPPSPCWWLFLQLP